MGVVLDKSKLCNIMLLSFCCHCTGVSFLNQRGMVESKSKKMPRFMAKILHENGGRDGAHKSSVCARCYGRGLGRSEDYLVPYQNTGWVLAAES